MARPKKKHRCKRNFPVNKYLPLELWTEIMARLPVKTLLQFRCVCKSWCTIIDSRNFTFFKHLTSSKNNNDNPNLLVMHGLGSYGYDGRSFTVRSRHNFRRITELVRTPERYNILGTCNGLVLYVDECDSVNLMLWNPSVRKSLALPPCPVFPVNRFCNFVLGFVSSCDDYRVVCFCWKDNDRRELGFKGAIYSLNDHFWRIKTFDEVDFPHLSFAWTLVQSHRQYQYRFLQGGAHWLVCHYDAQSWRLHSHVLSFDFSTEKFRYVRIPDNGKTEVCKYLFVLGESLAIFETSSQRSCIWIMSKDGGEDPWSLWFSKDSADIYDFFLKYVNARLSFDENSATFFVLDDFHDAKNVVSYNLISCQEKPLGRTIKGPIFHVDTYVESLVLSRASEGQTLTPFPLQDMSISK